MHRKINEQGEYLPFEGYTVISFLKDRESEFWTKFCADVSKYPIFSKYYTMLPASSLHMTVKNFMSVANKDYEKLVQIFAKTDSKIYDGAWGGASLFAKMSDVCNVMNVEPVCKIANMYTERSLGLDLDVLNKETIEKLRSLLVIMGMKPEPDFKFHMTFAYKFKKVEEKDHVELQKEFKKIYDVLSKKFQPSLLIEFEKAQLCYFPDMTSYEPC